MLASTFHCACAFPVRVGSKSGQPNNSSTSTHKGAEPSSAQVSHDSHSPTHPPTHTHTHSRSVTLTLNTITRSLTHYSFTLPVMHSLTHELITFALPHYASRGTQNDSKLATHVVGWHMPPVPSPILSSPASLEITHAGSPLNKWSFNNHRFPAK